MKHEVKKPHDNSLIDVVLRLIDDDGWLEDEEDRPFVK